MTLICPWCSKEVSLHKIYWDSDPTFIYFLYCTCKNKNYEFQYNINQDDNLCGYVLTTKLDSTGNLKIEVDLGNHSQGQGEGYIITLWNDNEVKKIVDFKPQILTTLEAKELLLKYKKLWAFS
jgi:hypothetical protein